jgi:hypothetical protein
MFRLGTVTLVLLAVTLIPVAVGAQQVRTVAGTVRSAADTTPLTGVRVRVLETAAQTQTNATGRFGFTNLPLTAIHLVFERLGVVTDTVSVAPGIDSVAVLLRPQAVPVSPLVAAAKMPARQRFEALAQTSTISLDPIEIERTPTLAEPDVARVAQLLPGTVAKNDYSVGVNVRGGESDQNLIRLDGITVFNPFHLGGLFSTFDASAVESVDLITGAFPARLGGRLSSVMDVALRPGRSDRVGVRGAVSVLSSRALAEGPIGSSGASFLIGGRRTYADMVAAAFTDDDIGYYFSDGLAKLTLPLGRGRLSATGYWGRDALDLPWIDAEPGVEAVDFAFSWGNRLAGVTWLQPIGAAQLDTHVDISEFTTRFGLVPGQFTAMNEVRQLAARTALGFRLADQNDVQLGVGIEDYRIEYDAGNASLSYEVPDGIWINDHRIPYDFGEVVLTAAGLDLDYRPRVWFAYLDNSWRPVAPLILRLGARLEHVDGGAAFTGVSPRVGAKLFLTEDLALTGSAGRYYQALHSIRDQEIPINLFDFWIGADEVTPVARSDQLVIGLERWFGRQVSLTVEGYTKSYDDLPLRNFEDDPRVRGDEFLIATGSAWGFDLLLRRHLGGVRGWISYSYAKATRDVGTEAFAPAHDRRHTLDIVLQTAGPFGSELSVRWGYGSGLPYTGMVGQWQHRQYNAELHLFELPQEEVIGRTINGERYPYYSRLDVGMRWQFHWLGGLWQPFLNIVNLYNRRNVFAYTFDYDSVPPVRSGWSQLPVVPTIGVEFEW